MGFILRSPVENVFGIKRAAYIIIMVETSGFMGLKISVIYFSWREFMKTRNDVSLSV